MNNMIFGSQYIQKCKVLEHLEIGGKPKNYLSGITFKDGIEKLCTYANFDGMEKLKFKVLKFEYCSNIGDTSIKALL